MGRKSMLFLLVFAVIGACSVSADEGIRIEGARELPAFTADGHVVWFRIDYSLVYVVDGPAPTTEMERDIVNLMALNADGIVYNSIATTLVPAASAFTREEIRAMVNGHPSENTLLQRLAETLHESLAEVDFRQIEMNLIDPGY